MKDKWVFFPSGNICVCVLACGCVCAKIDADKDSVDLSYG